MALLTTSIGSFPKPPELNRARRHFSEGELDAAALRRLEDDATRRAIRFQDDLRIDLLVDGEMDRADPVTTFAERLAGVEIDGWVRVYGDRYVRRPRITGELSRTSSTTIDRWHFARDAARGPIKAVLPGPYTLMDGSFDEIYGSRRELCLAFAEIVRDEAAELAAAGAGEIQIDEPAAGARPEELPLLREALERTIAPLRGRSRAWLYLGYPDFGVVGAELASLPADGLLVAAAHCGFEDLPAFTRAVPPDRAVGIGVIDVLDPRVESEREIRERIGIARGLVPSDRLWIVPDGGLRSLQPDVARAKLAVMVAAAR